MNLGQKIKELRIERDLTQKQLAKKISLTDSLVGMWEQNKREPTIDTVRQLCVIFDISADELLEIENEKQRKQVYINNSFNNNSDTKINLKL